MNANDQPEKVAAENKSPRTTPNAIAVQWGSQTLRQSLFGSSGKLALTYP